MTTETFSYNNEEEAEMAQLAAIHINEDAVAKIRAQVAKKALQPSLEECEDCGEDIPVERQVAIKGCTKCVYCANLAERRLKGL